MKYYIEYKGNRKDMLVSFNRVTKPLIHLKSGKQVFEADNSEAYHYFLRSNPNLLPLVPTPAENTELAHLRKLEEKQAEERAKEEAKVQAKIALNSNIAKVNALENEIAAASARYIAIKDELKALEKEGVELSENLANLSVKPKKKVKK